MPLPRWLTRVNLVVTNGSGLHHTRRCRQSRSTAFRAPDSLETGPMGGGSCSAESQAVGPGGRMLANAPGDSG
jgi:hypothetical protein